MIAVQIHIMHLIFIFIKDLTFINVNIVAFLHIMKNSDIVILKVK